MGQQGNNCKISVVMPVLNGMPYFPKALESVRNQALQELEILVVDAGSVDGTIEYITEMMEKDKRICLLRSDKRSMGYQYNIGIRAALGEYIGFCESDDYMEPDMFQDLYYVALEHDKPDTVKAGFYMFFEQEGKEISILYSSLPKNLNNLYRKAIDLSSAPEIYARDTNIWNGIYQRKFLLDNEISFNETSGAAFQDHGFAKMVDFLARRQIYVSEAYYHYRRDNDLCSSYKKDTALYVLHEWEYIIDFLDNHESVKQSYGDIALSTFMLFFDEQYARNAYFYSPLDYEEEAKGIRKKVVEFYESLCYQTKSKIVNGCTKGNNYITLFLNSWETYKESNKCNYIGYIKGLLELKNYICEKKQVIIFGAGELGQSICAFLLKNNYKGEIAFCDNSKANQGKRFMGKEVFSVDESVHRFNKECFIIPSGTNYYQEMSAQLINLGIRRDQIIAFSEIGPHSSMEVNWEYKIKDN